MFGFSLPLLGVLNWSFVGKMDHPVALVSWLAFDGRDLTSVFRDVAVSRRAGAWNLRGFFVSFVLSGFPTFKKVPLQCRLAVPTQTSENLSMPTSQHSDFSQWA